jgi:uncharacterized RDD family membrane protein YckC
VIIMNAVLSRILGLLLVLVCLTTAVLVHAENAPASAASAPASAAPSEHADDWNAEGENGAPHRTRGHRRGDDSDVVSIGHNAYLRANEKAEAVVSVFGSSTSEGEADNVVSVLGDTRAIGPVHDGAVAVLGNLYVDNKVDGDAVAVLGNVELGPHADIEGDVVAVLGRVQTDPAAVVHGGIKHISVGGVDFDWLHVWVNQCLLRGRPLAFAHGLGWAWSLALGALAFYILLAVMFRGGVSECVHTVETQPGRTALAALVATLLTPVLFVLLTVTVIGIPVVFILGFLLFLAGLFGKAVMLAWIGSRITAARSGPPVAPALAVLIGGLVVLLLYVVPVIGFLTYKLLGFFGFGAVVYTLLQGHRARQAAKGRNGAPPAAPPPPRAPMGAAFAGAAAAASAAQAQSPVGEAPPPDGSAAAPQAPSPGFVPPPPIAPHVLSSLPRAGFWVRMGALLIDVVLIGVLVDVAGTGFWRHEHLPLLALAVYGACMWKLRGSTVGGLVCDLRVVRVDGRPLEWETAIVRALGCFLSLAPVGLGFIWIALDPAGQAWHDKIAGTVVVRVPKGGVPA